MGALYRIFGSELSPYSVKVRAAFRYKGVPHQWLERGPSNAAEYRRFAERPLLPLVVTPEGRAIQDSTRILEHLEAACPEPSLEPLEPTPAFVSVLLEELADEWAHKWVFHYRWAHEEDSRSAARRMAEAMAPPGVPAEHVDLAAEGLRDRMVARRPFVGSSERTAQVIESSFRAALGRLEPHLAGRPYLLGERPSRGDFGLFGQLSAAASDPTAGGILRESAPCVMAWIERMEAPEAGGGFEPWPALAPSLLPFLREQAGALFLPWAGANARASASGEPAFTVELPGGTWSQAVQPDAARSLAELRDAWARARGRDVLDPVLGDAGCLEALRSG